MRVSFFLSTAGVPRQRKKTLTLPSPASGRGGIHVTEDTGAYAKYARLVGSASHGAVTSGA